MKKEEWLNLEHAYGEAGDIPGLLDALKSYPDCDDYKSEPFFSLWSSLCHQGDVYSASYAAVPYIVDCIETNPHKATYNYFLLPLCIEIARKNGKGPKIEESYRVAYFESIRKLSRLVSHIEDPSKDFVNVLSATIAIANGEYRLGEAILELNEEVLEEFENWLSER